MIIKGKLIKCKREKKEFEKGREAEGLFVTLAEVELSDKKKKELEEAFKDAGKKFTPAWIKEFEGYVNLKTQYELPYRNVEGAEFDSIEKGIADGLKWMNAEVKVSINVKEGAIYPNAIVFLSEGTAFNAFGEFDNDEED